MLKKIIRALARSLNYEIARIKPPAPPPAIPDGALYQPLFSPWLGGGEFKTYYEMAAPKSLVTPDRCYVLYTLLRQAVSVPGDVWECGVYKGGTGLRQLEKYAVRVGGGINHRTGLYDGVLIKENHIAAAGGISEAIRRARAYIPHTLKIEIETETLAQVDEALAAGADIIMLDNMSLDDMRSAVATIGGRAEVEASGGVNLERVRAIAETGVDIISVGALTHSPRAMDISMLLD